MSSWPHLCSPVSHSPPHVKPTLSCPGQSPPCSSWQKKKEGRCRQPWHPPETCSPGPASQPPRSLVSNEEALPPFLPLWSQNLLPDKIPRLTMKSSQDTGFSGAPPCLLKSYSQVLMLHSQCHLLPMLSLSFSLPHVMLFYPVPGKCFTPTTMHLSAAWVFSGRARPPLSLPKAPSTVTCRVGKCGHMTCKAPHLPVRVSV